MLLVDVNVLLHSVNARATQHDLANRWLDRALNDGSEPLGFAWMVSIAFLRLATNPSVFTHPFSAEQAGDALEGWLGAPHSLAVEPTHRHLALLRGLLVTVGTAGNLANDAHLAALALEHDATIVSFDRDFGRFEGLRWRLPE